MPLRFSLLFLMILGVNADDPQANLEKCKGVPNESTCGAKIVLDYLQKNLVTPGGGSSGIYCKCRGESTAGKASLFRIVPGQMEEKIADNLSQSDCLQAMRFYPCQARESFEDVED